MTVTRAAPIEPAPNEVEELTGSPHDAFADRATHGYEPFVMRGFVSDWPAVAAGRGGATAMAAYIAGFDKGGRVSALVGPPEKRGRFLYDEVTTGLNCERRIMSLREVLSELLRLAGDELAPSIYAGATAAGELLPGWTDANPLPLPARGATPRVWIGNRSHVSTHFDASGNIACVVAGRRRVALFPPEQIGNLYVGPLDMTIAGQPTSVVDVTRPGLVRYPLFADALESARVVDLAPATRSTIPPCGGTTCRRRAT